MRFIVHVPRHWTEELDALGEATKTALLRYRRGLKGLRADMRLVRVRCDLVNYGLVDDPAATDEHTVEIEDDLATWLGSLAAFVNRDVIHRGATVRGILRMALRLYRAQAPELGSGGMSGVDGTAGKREAKV